MSILISIIIIGVIILVHELGHFLTAKFFKMPINEFSIGMGPSVYSYTRKDIKYSFRAIPFGGYVSIDGMELESSVEGGFNSKPAYQRFIVLFAGVFMNFLMAFLILFSMALKNGKSEPVNDPVIGSIYKEASAFKDLKVDDKIIEINGEAVEKWLDIKERLKGLDDSKDLSIELERNNEVIKLNTRLTYNSEADMYYLGIGNKSITKKLGVLESLKVATSNFKRISIEMVRGVQKIITGKASASDVSGPIGIIKVVNEATAEGIDSLLFLVMILSINIGMINLLPLPAIDGGRILFLLLEVVGIKINKRVEETINKISLVVFFMLILFISIHDIFNLFKK